LTNSILVLGLGNTLLTDEAAGIAVIRQLEKDHGDLPNVRYMDGGTLSFTLADPIAEASGLIVVDAAALGESPGTVRVFENEAMDRQLSGKGKSVHEVSLADLLDMARLTDTLPEKRCLVGIEPEAVDWGEQLTPPVAAAVPKAVTAIRDVIERWNAEN
jgi:hydrogenase maturation protease